MQRWNDLRRALNSKERKDVDTRAAEVRQEATEEGMDDKLSIVKRMLAKEIKLRMGTAEVVEEKKEDN